MRQALPGLAGFIPAAATTTRTVVRPSADATDGGWLNEASSNVNLYASVDDSPTDDATWIQSPLSASPDECKLQLGDPGGSPTSGGMVLNLRAKRV